MKKFAKFLLCTLLIAVSCTALLVGCQTTEDKLQNSPLIGTWVSEPEGGEKEADYWIIEYDSEYSTDKLKRTVWRASRIALGGRDAGQYRAGFVDLGVDKIDINNDAFKVSGDTLTITSSVSGKVSIFKRTSQTLQEWKNAYTSEFDTVIG